MPAPVNLFELRDDLTDRFIVFGPMPPVTHPRHPLSDWNLYGRPEPAPWGSYMDTTPLPMARDGRGPITVMHDTIEALEVTR